MPNFFKTHGKFRNKKVWITGISYEAHEVTFTGYDEQTGFYSGMSPRPASYDDGHLHESEIFPTKKSALIAFLKQRIERKKSDVKGYSDLTKKFRGELKKLRTQMKALKAKK